MSNAIENQKKGPQRYKINENEIVNPFLWLSVLFTINSLFIDNFIGWIF